MPRPKRPAGVHPAYASLLALQDQGAAAAAAGVDGADALHRQIQGYMAMLAAAGNDDDIAELFDIFAAEARSRLDELAREDGHHG